MKIKNFISDVFRYMYILYLFLNLCFMNLNRTQITFPSKMIFLSVKNKINIELFIEKLPQP